MHCYETGSPEVDAYALGFAHGYAGVGSEKELKPDLGEPASSLYNNGYECGVSAYCREAHPEDEKEGPGMRNPPNCAHCNRELDSVDIVREVRVKFQRNARWDGEERWEVHSPDTYAVDYQVYAVQCPDCGEDHYHYLHEGPPGFPYINVNAASAWIVRDINGYPVNEAWFKPEAMRAEEV